MSWSMDAVRQAWNTRERARYRMAKLAQGLADDSMPSPSPMESAVSRVTSLLAPRYVVEVFNDFIIVEGNYEEGTAAGPRFDGPIFKVDYTVDDKAGSIEFSDQLVPVQIDYKPKVELSKLHRTLLAKPMHGVDVTLSNDDGTESVLRVTLDDKLVAIAE